MASLIYLGIHPIDLLVRTGHPPGFSLLYPDVSVLLKTSFARPATSDVPIFHPTNPSPFAIW